MCTAILGSLCSNEKPSYKQLVVNGISSLQSKSQYKYGILLPICATYMCVSSWLRVQPAMVSFFYTQNCAYSREIIRA